MKAKEKINPPKLNTPANPMRTIKKCNPQFQALSMTYSSLYQSNLAHEELMNSIFHVTLSEIPNSLQYLDDESNQNFLSSVLSYSQVQDARGL